MADRSSRVADGAKPANAARTSPSRWPTAGSEVADALALAVRFGFVLAAAAILLVVLVGREPAGSDKPAAESPANATAAREATSRLPRLRAPMASNPAAPVNGATARWAEPPPAAPAPEKLCEAVGAVLPMGPWSASPLFETAWECVSEPRATAAAGDAYTLFAIARGSEKAALSQVRFKLSSADGDGARRGRTQLLAAARAGFGTVGRTLPREIETAVDALTPIRLQRENMTIEFAKEYGSVPRFNLTVVFAKGP